MRIITLGMMGRCPFGGQTWLSLNWLRAFQKLGHEVWYVEDDRIWPYDPLKYTLTDDCSYAIRHIRQSVESSSAQWAYRFNGQDGPTYPISGTELNRLYASCDLLLNFGTADLREEHMAAPLRIYIESDPVMSQLRLAAGDQHTRSAFAAHNRIFTYGENYGAPDCRVPLCGIQYGKTRQPIDLQFWSYAFNAGAPCFTTIGNYRQEGNDIEYQGESYHWSKHHEWEKFVGLPARTEQQFELAMVVGDPADREHLVNHGWRVVPPYEMSLDVFGQYPDFIRASRAEFTVAKDQNVRLRSGWFSERDACYLASGKPVVAQDTGFSNILPTGEGLFGFLNEDQALAAIDAINSDYPRHCRAAREIAEEYFEASKVAQRLLDQIFAD